MDEARREFLLGGRVGRRVVVAAVSVVALIGVFVGGWFAAEAFESPAQKEAEASPPPAGPTLAHVERGSLEQTFTASTTIAAESQLAVVVPATEGGGYVTATFVRRGETVRSGQLLLEVNGAPVLALPGAFPYYRDLTVGDSGRDVLQLQQGLREAGHAVAVDGRFGPATADAIAALYRQAGYPVPVRAPAGPDASPGEANPSRPPAADADGDAADPDTPDGTATPSPPPPSAEPFLPVANLMAFATLPATAVSVPAVGNAVGDGTKVGVEFGNRVASGSIAASVAAVARAGMKGTAEHGGKSVSITVAAVRNASGDDESATIVATPTAESPFPPEWDGERVLLTVVMSKSAENALLVPSRAVVTDSHGGGTLLVKTAGGSFRHVDVKELGELDGRSAVEPMTGHVLTVGDQVRVD
ncbi:peptidoglycan-binding protein [Gryllotalpicola reticulitermitis]|uniref:Peptidoglycan-binding protein n=1 Tax=Gryllotalpicola reticulitermitis TaxID=1184153 RepID=A0ABV8QAE3_9MICO